MFTIMCVLDTWNIEECFHQENPKQINFEHNEWVIE